MIIHNSSSYSSRVVDRLELHDGDHGDDCLEQGGLRGHREVLRS